MVSVGSELNFGAELFSPKVIYFQWMWNQL